MSTQFRARLPHVLNAILAVMAVTLALHQSEPAPRVQVAVTNEAPVETSVFTRQPQSPKYPAAASASDQRRWLIDQLRAMGVPNDVLALVVLADLDKGWNRRGGELAIKFHGDPDKMAALQLEIDRTKDTEMRAALGEEGFRQWDQGNMLREVNQGKIRLTAAETDQAYDLWKKMQQRQFDLEQAKAEGTMDPADINDAGDKSASDFNQQMKTLLGDERYAESQQADDPSTALTRDLASMNPSDSQFQELLKAQQQWNDQRAALDQQFQTNQASADYAAQIQTLNDSRDQAYRQVLGTNAFTTLQKEQDPGYNQMKKYENLWGLDDTKIDSVYGAMKYYQKSVEDYQAQVSALQTDGQSVDWEAANKNIQKFADQTQQSLQNYLGQDVFNKMLGNGVFQLSLPALAGHNTQSQH